MPSSRGCHPLLTIRWWRIHRKDRRTVREDLFGPSAWGPLALALADFHAGSRTAVLRVHTDEGELDPMPVAVFFRGREDLRLVDREALARVRGRVLDGGAGAGSMTLLLQANGVDVTAVEVIPEAVEIMRARGVLDARVGRLEDLPEEGAFDTVLLLMNGTSLAGTLAGFPPLLHALARLMAPGGQVLVDSTDLGAGGGGESGDEGYPGELQYQLEYRGTRGAPFPQLFVDPGTLRRTAGEKGWEVEVVWRGEEGEYLARLSRPGR
jgi:SAM-dependent methyltransferase